MSHPDTMPPSRRNALLRLLKLATPYRWWMALAIVLGFATIGSSIGLMATSAWIIATAALHPALGKLQLAIVGVRFFGIARGVFRYLERYVAHRTTFRLLARLRVWYYRQVEPLAPAGLLWQRSGDLVTRAVADIETLENLYLRVIAPPAVAVLVLVGVVAFMAAHNLWLAAALLFWLAVAGIGLPVFVRALGDRHGLRLVTTRSQMNTLIVDTVQGLADLSANNADVRWQASIARSSRLHQHAQDRLARIAALDTSVINLATSAAAITTLIVAIPLVRDGSLAGVMLAVLVLVTITAFEAVQPLPQAAQQLGSNIAAANRLFEIANAPPPVIDPPTPIAPIDLTDLHPDVPLLTICDLTFRYDPALAPALDGVSFNVPAGSTVAVVGPSGAGKSTLVNLLLRFWEFDTGLIAVAGRDLRQMDADSARGFFSLVSQHPHLFNASIRENLRLARPDATDDDLWHVLTDARLDRFVRTLPDGLDTWIGEHGLSLSGGERQRLAIARAMLKNALLLILDEPTANLDPVTERDILATVFETLSERTILLITHRLVGLDAAAEILVMDCGRIVERGRESDLLRRDSVYARMWAEQHRILPFQLDVT
jgi:ATP-binding cassette subfamily C protein CydC